MKLDFSDPQNYRLVRLQNGTDKLIVQSRIDDHSWHDEKEVASPGEGNAAIDRLRQEAKQKK
jgi:hypothetical protein